MQILFCGQYYFKIWKIYLSGYPRKGVSMKKDLKASIAEKMEELATKIPRQSNCAWLWGEVKLPECLRKEIEDEKMQDEK